MHGIVLLPNGKPARDVRVALLEAPKQAMTDSLGRFVLRTTYCGLATLVARRIAYVSASIDLVIPIGSCGQRQCAFVADAESIRAGVRVPSSVVRANRECAGRAERRLDQPPFTDPGCRFAGSA